MLETNDGKGILCWRPTTPRTKLRRRHLLCLQRIYPAAFHLTQSSVAGSHNQHKNFLAGSTPFCAGRHWCPAQKAKLWQRFWLNGGPNRIIFGKHSLAPWFLCWRPLVPSTKSSSLAGTLFVWVLLFEKQGLRGRKSSSARSYCPHSFHTMVLSDTIFNKAIPDYTMLIRWPARFRLDFLPVQVRLNKVALRRSLLPSAKLRTSSSS